VRHNRGGGIDLWIIGKLLRKARCYWQPRVGDPTWNMQHPSHGHGVVLCDEQTASDGEAFSEGSKRLGLGKVIGKRTWGGEIWLSARRWVVERTFGWLMRHRRLFHDHETSTSTASAEAFVLLAMIRIQIRRSA